MATSFPDPVTLQSVLDIATRAPSSGNLQPWRWRVDPDAVHLYADWGRRPGGSPTDRRDVLLSCGAVLDHCVVAFAAAGWSPRVRRFPDGGQDGHLAILEVVEQPPKAANLELAGAIPQRRADRRRYRRAGYHRPRWSYCTFARPGWVWSWASFRDRCGFGMRTEASRCAFLRSRRNPTMMRFCW